MRDEVCREQLYQEKRQKDSHAAYIARRVPLRNYDLYGILPKKKPDFIHAYGAGASFGAGLEQKFARFQASRTAYLWQDSAREAVFRIPRSLFCMV